MGLSSGLPYRKGMRGFIFRGLTFKYLPQSMNRLFGSLDKHKMKARLKLQFY
jgi:hypothetical protein